MVATRPAVPQDEDFLFELYCAVRAAEFALLPLPDEQRMHLLKMQHTWQRDAYGAAYPGSGYEIVLLNGEPAGRIWVARLPEELRLVDLAVHPRLHNQGIGTVLLQRLQAEAARSGKRVCSSVFRFNAGSLRFHQRLGFRVIAENETRLELAWAADASQ